MQRCSVCGLDGRTVPAQYDSLCTGSMFPYAVSLLVQCCSSVTTSRVGDGRAGAAVEPPHQQPPHICAHKVPDCCDRGPANEGGDRRVRRRRLRQAGGGSGRAGTAVSPSSGQRRVSGAPSARSQLGYTGVGRGERRGAETEGQRRRVRRERGATPEAGGCERAEQSDVQHVQCMLFYF